MKKYILVICCTLYFMSSITAQSWTLQTSGTTQNLSGLYMLDENNGWICGDGGTLLHTTNKGSIWTQVNITNEDLSAIAFRDQLLGILVGDNGRIFRTNNGGTNWIQIASNVSNNLASVVFGDGAVVFVSGRDGAALISSDNGLSWTTLNSGTAARFRGAGIAGSTMLWAVGENGIIRHSSNQGGSWVNQNSGISNDDLHDIQFLSTSVGYAGGSGDNIIYTSNGGALWSFRNSGINFGINGIFFNSENIGWAASDGGIVYKTTNAGMNWAAQNTGSNQAIKEVHFKSEQKGWAVGDLGTIAYYDDPNVPVELISFLADVDKNNVILRWSTASEVNNKGFEVQRLKENDNWQTAGFINGKGNSTTITEYSFTDKKLAPLKYKYRIKQIDLNGSYKYYTLNREISIAVPVKIELEQNYPNPFNPVTKINYSLPENGLVQLTLYNILGEKIRTLINEFQEKGTHSYTLNASDLKSGVYLYKVEAGTYVQTKKMILAK